ncbi:MAG: hypothetical protein DMF89_25505 [Acidobacteria bacterium]|nr:MAG: hypothetical protein DMF89_25505 [Acidobacteriota bacterium]
MVSLFAHIGLRITSDSTLEGDGNATGRTPHDRTQAQEARRGGCVVVLACDPMNTQLWGQFEVCTQRDRDVNAPDDSERVASDGHCGTSEGLVLLFWAAEHSIRNLLIRFFMDITCSNDCDKASACADMEHAGDDYVPMSVASAVLGGNLFRGEARRNAQLDGESDSWRCKDTSGG